MDDLLITVVAVRPTILLLPFPWAIGAFHTLGKLGIRAFRTLGRLVLMLVHPTYLSCAGKSLAIHFCRQNFQLSIVV